MCLKNPDRRFVTERLPAAFVLKPNSLLNPLYSSGLNFHESNLE
ncbi:MAG: hypothetical protein OXB86_02805 [Bdellovibrionales bacterium]|nr:hypothetical protein [Bdellovibrionales bacterium]